MELQLIPAAFLTGVLMFLAPCTLPIVPGYLAFIAGVPPGEEKRSRGRVVKNAIAFVIGFTIFFVLLGTAAGYIGSVVAPWRAELGRVAGAMFILFGLTMLGLFRLPILSNSFSVRIPKFLSLGRPESSFLIGALFAMGWSPCIGPILGSIFLVASIKGSVLMGGILLAVFSLGLGLPFLLCAIFIDKVGEKIAKLGKLTTVLSYIGGVVLIGIGILMLMGNIGLLTDYGFGLFDAAGYKTLLQYL
jgi:cytochrome c-type biogenesis protein